MDLVVSIVFEKNLFFAISIDVFYTDYDCYNNRNKMFKKN